MSIFGAKLFFESIKCSFSELKKRIFFVIGALIVFRIGSFIPIPGINIGVITNLLEQQRGTIIEMFNLFSGGALSRASIFTLGIMPYISSSIIVQLLTVIHPSLAELKKEGEEGRRKINQYTRYGTLILSIFQSVIISISIPNMSGMQRLVLHSGYSFYFIAVVSLVCGTMFLMWLGEQITDKGIGNGISIIIFSGIIAGLPSAIGEIIENSRQGNLHLFLFFFIIFVVALVTFVVVFIERGQRKIIVNYAKCQHGYKMYSHSLQSTHLPLKINMAGVIPAIFASSVILFPATILSWFGSSSSCRILKLVSLYLQPGQFLYLFFYACAIIFFCFFYTSLVFNPRETADNLKRSGAFIPGMRPGEQTARYIHKIMNRLTLIGSIYITLICLLPEVLRVITKVPFYFGGTSLLIVVVVIMDFMNQIQTLMMSSQYESALRKANLKE